jgi:hypothetical protein
MTNYRVLAVAAVAALAIAACQPGAEGTPGAETPALETPGMETPGMETPGMETPGMETPGMETPGMETPDASPQLNQALLVFEAVGDSGITGGVILTDLEGTETAVTVGVVALGFEDPMPAAIEEGTCADADAAPGTEPAEELLPVEFGASNTVIERSLDDLLAGDYRITLRRSAAEAELVACADIERMQ